MRRVVLAFVFALALLAPAQASPKYFLWIGTAVPVEAKDVTVSGFGFQNAQVFVDPYFVTVMWTAPTECFDLRVSGPRIVGRSTELSGCAHFRLPLVLR